MNQFQPAANYAAFAAQIIFYLLAVVSLFFSISTVYSLIKYSRSRGVGLFVSLIYVVIYLALISNGINILNTLK